MHRSFTWFLIGVFSVKLASAQDAQVGCYSNGECRNAAFNNYQNVPQPEQCHLLCIDTPECLFWTHYSNDIGDNSELPERTCFNYLNCPEFSSDCSTGDVCVSGQVECLVRGLCEFDGRCDGDQVDLIFNIPDLATCAELCACEENCNYWSYNSADLSCNLVSYCPFVDRTCETCTSGEQGCDVYECNLETTRL